MRAKSIKNPMCETCYPCCWLLFAPVVGRGGSRGLLPLASAVDGLPAILHGVGVFLLLFCVASRSVMAGLIENPTRRTCCPCCLLSIALLFDVIGRRGVELLPSALIIVAMIILI